MKKWTKLFALMLAVVLLCTALSACGQSGNNTPSSKPNSTPQSTPESKPESTPESTPEDTNTVTDGYAYEANTEPITLTIFDSDPDSSFLRWGENPASRRTTELTGISFEAVVPVVDDETKLQTLIASDDLPDIVTGNYFDTCWQSMISNGQLEDMEALAEKYTPKLKSELVDPELWEYCRSDDGKIYTLLSCFSTKSHLQWLEDHNFLVSSNQPCVLIRQDYYEEVGSPEVNTPDEFIDMLLKIKENHPDCIPFYTDGQTRTGPSYLRWLFGVCSYYVNPETKEVSSSCRDPKYLDMYIWVNKMVKAGLMPEDNFVDGYEEAEAKITAGKPATFMSVVADGGRSPADNPDTIYYPMKPWNTYEAVRSNAGYLKWGVSVKASDEAKDAAMRWTEFANTELGAQTLVWGVEGPADGQWDGDFENGATFFFEDDPKSPNGRKATWYSGYYDAMMGDWSGVCKKTGLCCYQNVSLTNQIYGDMTQVTENDMLKEMNEWFAPTVRYDNALYFNLSDDPAVVYQTYVSLISEYNIKWAYAEDEAEVRALFDEFSQRYIDAGEPILNQFYTETYKAQGGA